MYDPRNFLESVLEQVAESTKRLKVSDSNVDAFYSAHGIGVDLKIIVTKQQLVIISDPKSAGSPAITTDANGEITGFFYGKTQKIRVVGHSLAIHRSRNYKVSDGIAVLLTITRTLQW